MKQRLPSIILWWNMSLNLNKLFDDLNLCIFDDFAILSVNQYLPPRATGNYKQLIEHWFNHTENNRQLLAKIQDIIFASCRSFLTIWFKNQQHTVPDPCAHRICHILEFPDKCLQPISQPLLFCIYLPNGVDKQIQWWTLNEANAFFRQSYDSLPFKTGAKSAFSCQTPVAPHERRIWDDRDRVQWIFANSNPTAITCSNYFLLISLYFARLLNGDGVKRFEIIPIQIVIANNVINF